MKYIQFYQMSTGYVEGSKPPRFDDANKKPIEAVGSEYVYVLDGRHNLNSCLMEAAHRASSPRYHRCVGYKIMQGRSFTDAKPISGYVEIQR